MRIGIVWGMVIGWGTVLAAEPCLEYVYPAGVCADSACEVEIGGTHLGNVTQAVISGEGVKAFFLGPVRTVTRNQKGREVPVVLPDRYRFRVVADPEAAPGIRALRVATAHHLSEPVRFEVGTMSESSEPATLRTETGEVVLSNLPACLNGRCHGRGADVYRFRAAPGSAVVAFVESRTVSANGFVPALTFTDAAGKPCANMKAYDGEDAPVLVLEVREEGEYRLLVAAGSDAEGGDGCVYRIKLGALPLVTGLTPDRAREGESLNVRLAGHNLARSRLRLFTGGKDSARCLATLTEGALALPSLRFDLANEAQAPGFEATLTPASLNIPPDGSALVRVEVRRRNGFEGAVRVELDFPPLSIASQGGLIPAGESFCLMTVSTDGARYPRTVFSLPLTATAEINGQPVKRPVVPVRQREGNTAARPQSFDESAARVNPTLYALHLNVAPRKPLSLSTGKPMELMMISSTLAVRLGNGCKTVVVWPERGITVQDVQRTNRQERARVMLRTDPSVLQAGASGYLILGCVEKKAPKGPVMAVTQSVPFTVK